MSDRATKSTVEERVRNVNRRMKERGSRIRYFSQMRNGHMNLDRCDEAGRVLSHVRAGTKSEIAEFLHAMMVALDDAATA